MILLMNKCSVARMEPIPKTSQKALVIKCKIQLMMKSLMMLLCLSLMVKKRMVTMSKKATHQMVAILEKKCIKVLVSRPSGSRRKVALALLLVAQVEDHR